MLKKICSKLKKEKQPIKYDILSPEEIGKLEEIDLEIVKLGLDEAKERLKDLLSTKNDLEAKANKLFSTQSFLATSIITILGIISKLDYISHVGLSITIGLIITIIILLLGMKKSVDAMKVSIYGTLGRHPSTWLQNDIINNKDNLGTILAYNLYDYCNLLDKSDLANKEKATAIKDSIYCLSWSIAPLLIGVIISLIF